jgi:hypothetical protein
VKLSHPKIGLLLLAPALLFCCGRIEKNELTDQSLLAIQEEFESGKYEKVLTVIDQYKASLETNSRTKMHQMKAESLEQIALALTRKIPKTNAKEYVKKSLSKYASYDIGYENGQFIYYGRDYGNIYDDQSQKTSAWIFRKKHLSLNDPFLIGNSPSDAALARFEALAKKQLQYLYGENRLTPEEKAELSEILLDAFLKIAFGQTATNAKKTEFSKSVFPELEKSAQAVWTYSDKKGMKAKALAVQLNLALMRKSTDKAKELMEQLVKDFPSDRYSAFAYAWLGDRYYVRSELGKAKAAYQSAQKIFSSPVFFSGNWDPVFPEIRDVEAFRNRVGNMIRLVQSEIDYAQFISKGQLAVVAADNVRLRKTMEAKSSKNVITTLNTGDKVLLMRRSESKHPLEGTEDYWYYVRLRNGNEGWIFGKFLLVF